MNAPAAIPAVRPMRLASFKVWTINEGSKWAVERREFPTLPEIEGHYSHPAYHGSTLLVLEHDELTGRNWLHAYRIRRGKWAGRRDGDTLAKVYPHHADKLFALPVTAFDPVEPWQFMRNCDVVGAGRDVIESQAVRS